MKVLFDAQIFRQQRYGGISRYFCELASRLAQDAGVTARIVAPHHRNAYLEDLDGDTVVGWPAQRWKRLGKLSRAVGRLVERRTLVRLQPDVVHETYYWGPLLTDTPARRVLTVYDMIHERFPQQFAPDEPTAAAKRRAVERADHVICISHSTRRDLLELLPVAEAKVSVTQLSASLPAPDAPAAASGAPYLLYVGDRSGYKNFLGLVAAFGASTALRELDLACFGGGELSAAEWAAIDAARIARSRIRVHAGDDRALALLYAGALGFVYPSLYEGFGIPPLEAMRCGCPVACSDTSSIPEVVGDAGVYFDPRDTESMRHALERLAGSETLRGDLRERGRRRLQQFSWERCAAETLAIYRHACAQKETAHA